METILPCDESTEDAVLGAVITYPEIYDEIATYFTDVEVFYQSRARMLWKKLSSMIRKKEEVNLLSVASSITKDDASKGLTKFYVAQCTSDVGVKGMTPMHARRLYEKFLMRKVIVKSHDIKEKASNNDPALYDLLSEAHTVFGELIEFKPSMAQDITDIISETLSSMKRKDSLLITTGYKNLDYFSGGLTRGEITIVGGRPGHGKTTLLINMLANVLEKGYRAVFFSRELPNSELLKKIICLESQELSYSLVRKNLFTDDDLARLDSAVSIIKKKYNKDKFLMFDNLKDFASSAAEVKKFKPDIIFDDYIQLIAYKGREEQRRLQIEKLVNDYKWLAKESNAVVVLASQLNRAIEHRHKTYIPQLSDLAESGAIEQVAENVFFSYYDYKVKGEAGKGKNIISLHACKVRYGESGVVDLGYDGNKCKIYNSLEELMTNDKDEIPF